MEHQPINSCRFVGQLYNYTLNVVGGHLMGKGELRLIDSETNTYQAIKLIAWYDLAQRMEEVIEGSWIHVLSSYAPSEFRGKLDDQFSVAAFYVL